MKKFFKNWSIFELILLILSPIIVLTFGLIFHSDALTIVTAIVGILTALFIAKGLIVGQFFGLAIGILYSIVSFQNRYFGEMFIYLIIMVPMHMWGIFEWTKHRNKKTETVEVNSIKLKEWVIVTIATIGIFVGFYFVLKVMNTNQLIISTFSVVDNIFAIYLLARRSKYGFVSYIANDLLLILLWGIPVFQGNVLLIPMLINPIVNLVNDIYGVVHWTKMQKQQKN